MNSPEERSEYLCNRRDKIHQTLAHFEALTDPSYVTPKGKDEEISHEAYLLRCVIKYDSFHISPLNEFCELRDAMILSAVCHQGYDVDTCTGDITRVPKVEFFPETH